MRHYLKKAAFAVARAFGAGDVMTLAPRLNGGPGMKVMADLSLWQQFQRVGGSLTPAQVSNIIRAADGGDMRRLMDLANDARQKDGHLQGILSQSEEAIAELDWQLVLPANAKSRDKRIMRWVEETIRACKGTAEESNDGFLDLIPHLSGAHYYGYAVSEIDWAKRDGRLVPRAFRNQAQRRFGFRASDGAFVWRDEFSSRDGIEVRKVYPNRFVVAMPRVTGDVPCREGLVRVLMWAALFRNWTLSDWLRTGEIAWKPWRIGTYEKAASDEDIDNLETVLRELSSNGSACIPETTKIDIEWAQGGTGGSNGQHANLFDVVGREMSKAVLGQTDTTDSSNSRGYAQAKVASDGEKRRIRSRARYVASVITRDVVRPLIELNFGRGVAVPEFQFILKEPVDLARFANGVGKLVSAGAEVTQAYVREQTGMPEPKHGDRLLKPLAKPKAAKPEDDQPKPGTEPTPPEAPPPPSDVVVDDEPDDEEDDE